MNMKSIWLYVIVFVVVFAATAVYMRMNMVKAAGEDFQVFHEKFLTDSVFQMSRINFPVEGLPDGAEKADFENGYYWTADNWEIHVKTDYEAEGYKRTLTELDSYVREILVHPQGWGLERRFMQIDGKWHLIYYASINAVKVDDGPRPS
jgi:hypothetical protein